MTIASVAAYRHAMADFAQMRTLDIWYAHLAEEEILAAARSQEGKKSRKDLKRAKKNFGKARTRDSLQALSKLAELRRRPSASTREGAVGRWPGRTHDPETRLPSPSASGSRTR